ncbi:MAG: hypothetical protein VZS44_07645 [Bacilli bacterium]|nr:hypothetical protein [Bacilli bacterium]
MKRIFIEKQVIGWERFTYEVPDDFKDYDSLLFEDDRFNYTDWEYLTDCAEETGSYEIYDEDYNEIKIDEDD